MELPPPDAVDAWVTAHVDAPHDWLAEAIDTALDAGRIRLAARLVTLLDACPEGLEPEVYERLQRAASWVVHDRARPEDVSHDPLAEAWHEARRQRWMDRARRRTRRGLGKAFDPLGVQGRRGRGRGRRGGGGRGRR